MKTRPLILIALLSALPVSSGLVSPDPSSQPAHQPANAIRAAAASDEGLVGMYHAGVLRLELAENGRYRLAFQPGWVAYGTYALDDQVITFTDESGDLACPADQHGRYGWSLAHGRLLIELLEDPCLFRADMMTYTAFRRVGYNRHWYDDQVDHPAN